MFVVWERRTERRRQRQTAILTHNFFFSGPYYTKLSSKPHWVFLFLGQSTQLETAARQRAPSTTASWIWLGPSLTPTDSKPSHKHLHITLHNTHDFRSTMWLLRLFTQVRPVQRHLWLTARSNVNMQQIYFYHQHHVALPAQISLSRHSSLSFIAPGRSSMLHPVLAHSCCM